MARRSKSSDRWLREHFTDPFVKRAKAEGWRSRAVFKLEEIDRANGCSGPARGARSGRCARGLEPVRAAAGRGAAGVSWPATSCRWSRSRAWSSSRATFASPRCVEELQGAIGEPGLDVLLSDMAPNLSGMDAIDAPRSMYLAELALEMAQTLLKPGGSALIKVLQGPDFRNWSASARRCVQAGEVLKPEASRARSPETYLLASGRRMV